MPDLQTEEKGKNGEKDKEHNSSVVVDEGHFGSALVVNVPCNNPCPMSCCCVQWRFLYIA